MPNILMKLTTESFISLLGAHPLVSDFSKEAVGCILTQYEGAQAKSDDPTSVEWEPLFNDAEEFNSADIIYLFKDEMTDRHEQMLDIARELDETGELGTDTSYWLNDESGLLNSIELFLMAQTNLMASVKFKEKAADVIAKDKGMTQMSNGSYIGLGNY